MKNPDELKYGESLYDYEVDYFSFLFKFPSGHVGLVTTTNADNAFSEIDRYGDPFSCKIRPIKGSSSICFMAPDLGEDNENCDAEISDIELSGVYDSYLEDKDFAGGWVWFKDWYEYEGGEKPTFIDQII